MLFVNEKLFSCRDERPEAISTIGGAVSARMIISYMRFASAVLGNPLASPEELRKNPSLKDLQDATATTGSEGRSSWDNTRIDKLIQGAGLDPEKKSLLDEQGRSKDSLAYVSNATYCLMRRHPMSRINLAKVLIVVLFAAALLGCLGVLPMDVAVAGCGSRAVETNCCGSPEPPVRQY